MCVLMMNVNTFLGAPAADVEPTEETVCCCMFGNRRKIYEELGMVLFCGVFLTAAAVVLAYIFGGSLVITGSVGVGIVCVVVLCSALAFRKGSAEKTVYAPVPSAPIEKA